MALKTGREIGRVNVRVVPNTKRFRKELHDKLDKDLRELRATATVDKVKVDRENVRRSLDRELEKIRTSPIHINNVSVRVNRARVDRAAIGRDIRRQLTEMNARVRVHAKVGNPQEFIQQVQRMINRAEESEFKLKPQNLRVKPRLDRNSLRQMESRLDDVLGSEGEDTKGRILKFLPTLSDKDREKFKFEMDRLIAEHDGDKISLAADLDNLAAQASLRWMTRDRLVNIFVRVSKASVTKAAAELARLAAAGSGGRLAFKWLEDILDMFKELDRNAPLFITVTTALTSAFAAIMSAGQGLIGIGGDLARMGPAFLVVPGLILNGLASVVTMIVALKNAKTELAELSDDMNELGDIINRAFWDQARDPIVNMTESLMPQLRNALEDTADATGRFIGEMANAFERHLGGGRLESIFDGINESWQILADGADGFAGALVNLSEIGARYMPGLAKWFSDLAADFNSWLTDISTSDQLDTWIQNAVFEMEELWRATKGAFGFLQALYDAANKAGGTGLTGLADMMGAWEEIANTEKFQRGLVAVFEGSMGAMAAFGDAIKAIGNLIGENDQAFKSFIESAGGFLGGLVEGIADALNDPAVMAGLNDFSDGLMEGIKGIVDGLDPFADTFGEFLSLLGDIAGTLLPHAVEALGNFMPVIDSVLQHLSDSELLDTLGSALVDITDELGPALGDLADALTPILIDALEAFAVAATALAPALGEAATAFANWIDDVGAASEGTWAEDLIPNIGELLKTALDSLGLGLQGLFNFGDLFTDPAGFIDEFKQKITDAGGWLEGFWDWAVDGPAGDAGRFMADIATAITPAAIRIKETFDDLVADIAFAWVSIGKTFDTWGKSIKETWEGFWNGIVSFVEDPLRNLGETIETLLTAIRTGNWVPFFDGLTSSGKEGGKRAGSSSTKGIADGIREGRPKVKDQQNRTRDSMVDAFDGIGRKFTRVGKKVPGGIADGIRGDALRAGKAAAVMRRGSIEAKFDGIGKRFSRVGKKVPGGIANGIRDDALRAGKAAAVMRDGSVLAKFKRMPGDAKNYGKEVPGSIGLGLDRNAWRAKSGAQAVVDAMSGVLDGLIGIAGEIGRRMAEAIKSWVRNAIGWSNNEAGKRRGGPSIKPSTSAYTTLSGDPVGTFSTLSTPATSTTSTEQKTLLQQSATTLMRSASLTDQVASHASGVYAARRAQVAYRPTPGIAARPSMVEGANVSVTMPMLPGETPAEQRENVVRDLRDAFA